MTLELKSLKSDIAAMLDDDGWTVEKLAVATLKELVGYKGIGRVGAANIIAEAAERINDQGLEVADHLAMEHYYQKASPSKVLGDWETDGFSISIVALTSARSLAILKGIDEELALRLIGKAQDIVNERGLRQSRIVSPGGSTRQINPAFDEKWLSGEVEPPPMAIRVARNFEAAQRAYKANNG